MPDPDNKPDDKGTPPDPNAVKPGAQPVVPPTGEPTPPASEPKPAGEPKPGNSDVVPQWRLNQEYGIRKRLERENADLKAQINPPTPAAEPSRPVWEEYEAQGKTAEQFNSDWIQYEVKEGIKAGKVKDAADTQQADLQTRWDNANINFQQKSLAAKAVHTDFDDVMNTGMAAGINLPPHVRLAISESDNAGELGYHVFKNHETAYKLMSYSPEQALIEIGRISATLPAGNGQSDPNLSKTPDPPNPLGGGSKAVTEFHNGMTKEEYFATRKPL